VRGDALVSLLGGLFGTSMIITSGENIGIVRAFMGMNVEDALPRITAPTLFMGGADDKMGGPEALMRGLAAQVPGARYEPVPDAAHIANVQNAEGFNAILRAFLTAA